MRDYTQFTQEERYQIEALLKMGHHQSEIAVVLKVTSPRSAVRSGASGVFAAIARSRRSPVYG